MEAPTVHTTGGSGPPLPSEVLEHILALCEPVDVAAFARTSRSGRALVYGAPDQHLWRQLFLHHFDDPAGALGFDAAQYDWRAQVCARTALARTAPREAWAGAEYDSAVAAVLSALDELPPHGAPSANADWLARVLDTHRGFPPPSAAQLSLDNPDHAGADIHDTALQARARLQALLALSSERLGPLALLQLGLFRLLRLPAADEDPALPRLRARRRAARSCVYDLRRRVRARAWGPFQASGSAADDDAADVDPLALAVDWTQLAAAVHTVVLNVFDLSLGADAPAGSTTRGGPFQPPRGAATLRAGSAPVSDGADPRDWAGVHGRWQRLVCFMDYRDLMAYNGQTEQRDPLALSPAYFDRPGLREAVRLFALELRVVEFSPNAASVPEADTSDLETNVGAEGGCAHPDILFEGQAYAAGTLLARLSGRVRRAADGTVRWSWTHAMRDGAGGWSSEGVQLGATRSASGVVGMWTGAEHEDDDPTGPFWMWKVPDDTPKVFQGYA